MAVHYFPAARNDIKNVLKWSYDKFGETAARRYKTLIAVAIKEIGANANIEHSNEVGGLQSDIRLYHLKHSRDRAIVDGQIVKRPRHFIAYKTVGEDTVIVRVLHDRMEIVKQLEESL